MCKPACICESGKMKRIFILKQGGGGKFRNNIIKIARGKKINREGYGVEGEVEKERERERSGKDEERGE